MASKTISVTTVEYLNSALFVHGLRELNDSGVISLSLDNPAVCAQKLRSGQAMVGLVPVAALPELRPVMVFSDYCIGATSAVRSVRLFSRKPYNELKTILLDSHSRTSAKLIEILARKYWELDIEFFHADNGFEKDEIDDDTGILIIGDKVFAIEDKFNYSVDLAEEWIKRTGLPFVFAVWVSMIPLDESQTEIFNQALRSGLSQQEEVIKDYLLKPAFQRVDIAAYLTNNISYPFDDAKKKGMDLFLSLI